MRLVGCFSQHKWRTELREVDHPDSDARPWAHGVIGFIPVKMASCTEFASTGNIKVREKDLQEKKHAAAVADASMAAKCLKL